MEKMGWNATFAMAVGRMVGGGIFSVLVALVCAGCGGGPTHAPLAQLAAEQEAYDGRKVATEGTVVPIEDEPGADVYFVLEDSAGNRVRLLPDSAARRHVGTSVMVTGTFRFDPSAGRQLHVDTIER